MRITYQKRDGCIFQRYRDTSLPYKIGEETSMGWKVLNIEYEYKNKYYSEYEYNRLIYKNRQKYIKKRNTKEKLKEEFKTFLYSIIMVLIIYSIKSLLNI